VPFRWLLTQTRRHALFPQLPRHLHTLGSKPLFISLVASAPLVKLLLGSPAGTATANGATYLVTDEGVFWVRRIRFGDIAWLEAAVSQHPAAMVNFSWA
jgi:hypothetical protein